MTNLVDLARARWRDKDLAIASYLRYDCSCSNIYIGEFLDRTPAAISNALYKLRNIANQADKGRYNEAIEQYIKIVKYRKEYLRTKEIPEEVKNDRKLYATVILDHPSNLDDYKLLKTGLDVDNIVYSTDPHFKPAPKKSGNDDKFLVIEKVKRMNGSNEERMYITTLKIALVKHIDKGAEIYRISKLNIRVGLYEQEE